MAEYIDKEELLKKIGSFPLLWEYGKAVEKIYEIVENEKPADVEPVIHGRWVQERELLNHFVGSGTSFHCSACGRKAGHNQVKAYHYCPRCGAKMDKEV